MNRTVFQERTARPARVVKLAVAIATLGVLALPASAGAYVYWADFTSDSVGRANLDGSSADEHFITGASRPEAIAVDGAHVYWENGPTGTIARANLDGSGANESFIAAATPPYHAAELAVDAGHLYWTDAATNAIARANLDGSDVNPSFIGGGKPCAVAVDGAHVYWVNGLANTIGRANLDGSEVNQSFISGVQISCTIAVGGGHVYWTNDGADTIGRANLDGSGVEEGFITTASIPYAVAADAAHIYWSNGDIPEAIGRANLDGTDVNQLFIPGVNPSGIAVDSLPHPSVTSVACTPGAPRLPASTTCTATVTDTDAAPSAPTGLAAFASSGRGSFGHARQCTLVAAGTSQSTCAVKYTPSTAGRRTLTASYAGDNSHVQSRGSLRLQVAKPSNHFRLSKPKLNERKGTAVLIATVPGKGRVVLKGRGIERKTVRARGADRLRLTVEPTRRTRRTLKRTGKARVRAKLTYTPTGGGPATKSRKLTLRAVRRLSP